MNWKRLDWLAIILLIAAIIWASMLLKENYEKMSNLKSDSSENSIQHLALIQNRISSQREYIKELETIALWPAQADVMSWLTQQADESSVQLVGVEHPLQEKIPKYESVNVNIGVRGKYNALGMFVNRLERSPNAVRINSMRMRRKESTPEHITMDISLSCIKNLKES